MWTGFGQLTMWMRIRNGWVEIGVERGSNRIVSTRSFSIISIYRNRRLVDEPHTHTHGITHVASRICQCECVPKGVIYMETHIIYICIYSSIYICDFVLSCSAHITPGNIDIWYPTLLNEASLGASCLLVTWINGRTWPYRISDELIRGIERCYVWFLDSWPQCSLYISYILKWHISDGITVFYNKIKKIKEIK